MPEPKIDPFVEAAVRKAMEVANDLNPKLAELVPDNVDPTMVLALLTGSVAKVSKKPLSYAQLMVQVGFDNV